MPAALATPIQHNKENKNGWEIKMVGIGNKSGMNRAGGGNASPGEFNSALFMCNKKGMHNKKSG